MKRWFFFTAAIVILAFGIGATVGRNADGREKVITTARGETVVVQTDRGGPGPLFIIVPLAALGFFAFSQRGRSMVQRDCGNDHHEPPTSSGGSGTGTALSDEERAAQWRAWHDAQHAQQTSLPAVPSA